MDVQISIDLSKSAAELRAEVGYTKMDVMLEVLQHKARILGSRGLYTKFQYPDGSLLNVSPWDGAYVAMSADKNCWCHDRVLHDAGLCDPSKRKKIPQSAGV